MLQFSVQAGNYNSETDNLKVQPTNCQLNGFQPF